MCSLPLFWQSTTIEIEMFNLMCGYILPDSKLHQLVLTMNKPPDEKWRDIALSSNGRPSLGLQWADVQSVRVSSRYSGCSVSQEVLEFLSNNCVSNT